MASACLRAWVSAKCAASLNEYIWMTRQVNTTNLYKGQLALLGRLVLTAHQLESLKPLKVENEFRAVTPGESGKLVVENLRYKTRVRKSEQTRVILEDSCGGRVECQAVTAVGKRTTVVPSKGRYQGDIQRVSVEGREEMTCAEKACDTFILRVLRKEINLHSRPLINILWFPPPILAQTPRHKHISPVSPAFSRLNTSQRQVAAAMISTTEPVVIAHGPPGTGKTTTIAAAVDYWQQESKPVWIVAQSMKNIARSLVGKNFHNFKLIVSKEFHFEWHEELYALVEHNLIRSDELARDPDPIETERKLAGSRIILCTLSMLSNPFLDDASVYSFVPVERLVVDEASQINISEYMHLIYKFKKLQKLCFFGDPKQLPPFGQEAAPAMQSIFEVKHLKPQAYFLDTQYRMPIPLGNFISDEVYNKKLKSVHKISDISCVSFVDVDKGTEESCGKSWTNSSEVQVIVTLVRRYYRRKPFAIITPYDPQRAAIQAALEKENLPSDCVYTVDSFQGHEQDFIIVSTVRTSAPGFLSSLHRNNVMLSRPTTGMVIVTNKHFLMSSGRDTLVGRLAKRWEVLANGKDCVWINWRQVADETAHLPGVHAPKQPESIVAAQTPAANVIPSSLQFGNFDDLYEPYNDLRGLRITEATSSLPLCKAPQHSGKHDPKVKTKGRRVGWYHS